MMQQIVPPQSKLIKHIQLGLEYEMPLCAHITPKNKEPKLEKRKRIGRCGEIFIERKLFSDSIGFPQEPDFATKRLSLSALQLQNKEDKTGSSSLSSRGEAVSNLANAEPSQEYYYKHYQDNYFGDIYAFSDGEDTMEDLDKRFKQLGQSFKSFNKQKKRQTTEKQSNSLSET